MICVSCHEIFWNSEVSFPPGGKGGSFADFMPPPGMPGSYVTVMCFVAAVPELGFSIHFENNNLVVVWCVFWAAENPTGLVSCRCFSSGVYVAMFV